MRIKGKSSWIGLVVTLTGVAAGWAADEPPALERPKDLRELVFLSSGYGMAYGPARDAGAGSPPFTNVYVTPAAYRAFMQSGVWPEGTAFFLEVRKGDRHVSINSGGSSQGDLLALEASVKGTRYPDGWAYFDFADGGRAASARPLPRTESCYSCHRRHGAVEWTFTQFYPDQFAVARRKGTVRKDYDPSLQAE